MFLYYPEIIFIDKEMGCCFSFNGPKIKIIDETLEGGRGNFIYLRPEVTITYSIDGLYDIPLIKINFNGWFESSFAFVRKVIKVEPNFCS